jgi:hypothetical protein
VNDKKESKEIACSDMNGIEYPKPTDHVDELVKEEDIVKHDARQDDNGNKDEHDGTVSNFLQDVKFFLFRSREGIRPTLEDKEGIEGRLLRDLPNIFSVKKIVFQGACKNTVEKPEKIGQDAKYPRVSMERCCGPVLRKDKKTGRP